MALYTSLANSISTAVNNATAAFVPVAAGSSVTINLVVTCVLVLIGGSKRIGKITELLVPFPML